MTARIAVVHSGFNSLGGAEYVCLSLMEALHERGYGTILCTGKKQFSPIQIKKVTGVGPASFVDEFVTFESGLNIPLPGMYRVIPLLRSTYAAIKTVHRKFQPKHIFVTQPIAIIPKETAHKTTLYVHCPIEFELDRIQSSHRFHFNYYQPLKFFLERKGNYARIKVLTNSKFTARMVKSYWHKDAKVIYPPCPLHLDLPIDEKTNSICTIGRFSPEKGYDKVLDLAKRLPSFEFHLIGRRHHKKRLYLKKICDVADKLGNVHMHLDASFENKRRILKHSKVLFHAMKNEHFGIVLIEAMSCGAVAVVNDSGGAKEDQLVPSEFRWQTLDQAEKIIAQTMSLWNLELANQLRERSKRFSKEEFQKSIVNYVETEIN